MRVTIGGGTSPYKITYTAGGITVNRTNYLSGSSIVVAPGSTTTYALAAVVDAKNVSIPVSGTATIEVKPKPATPFIAASDKTIFCAGESVTLTSSQGPVGSTYKWTPGNAATQEITATTSGSYTVQITSNGCTSNNSIAKVVTTNPKSAAPTIETVTQPTCSQNKGSIALNNLPATGTWIINPGAILGSGSTTTISGLNPGNYSFTLTNENGCASTSSPDVTIITPTSLLIGPILNNAAVSCNQTSYLLSWDSIENAAGYKLDVATDGNFTSFLSDYENKELSNTTSLNIIGMVPDITYYIRLRAFDGCGVSQYSNIITALIPSISTPIVSLITQPICPESTGSATLENLPSIGNWTINPGNIIGTGTSTTISGLTAGTYQFTVTNDNGCVSIPSENIIINSQLLVPSIPVLNSQTIGCQSSFIQTWQASENAAGYKLDIATDADFTTFLTGYQNKDLGNVTADTVTGMVSNINYYIRLRAYNECAITQNSNIITALIPSISTPIVSLITQPICPESTGSATLENLPSIGNWTINPGNIIGTGTSTTISGLTAGTYQFTVTNDNGCFSVPSEDIIINSPLTPSIPVLNLQTIGCQSYFIQTWQPSENAAGYRLDIATDPNFTTFLTGYQNKELGNVTAETVTGVLCGGTYYVRIKSLNNCGTSLYSNTIIVKIGTTGIERNRIWLNLQSDAGGRQMLLGYVTGATNEYDKLYDATTTTINTDLYSINNGRNYNIQGRAVPFDIADVVPLGYRAITGGTFTIRIYQVDGIFVNQAVYLEDKVTNTVHNLKNGLYSFTTAIGTFQDRFVLRYTNSSISGKKGNTSKDINAETKSDLIIATNANQINIKSTNEVLKKVAIYNINGQLMYENNSIDMNSLFIDKIKAQNQILIVKVTLENGKISTYKIIL
ncbi:hypothetical protein CLU82_3606 [Flavobacterium sp. 5]|nr:hypothetical protein CLU82_3606 [Flavobacterium sp. 5]